MTLLEKLLTIQTTVDTLFKDGENKSDRYNYVSSDLALGTIRPLMNELMLLLEMHIVDHKLHEGTTKSGTTRYMTEIDLKFVWVDVESGESKEIPFYAQGVDLAGEKGVGKALTYAEKYFLLKFFHIPTSKDDPDSDGRIKSGEKTQRNSQAQKETAEYHKLAIMQMLKELSGGDNEKTKVALLALTSNKDKNIAGVNDIELVKPLALPVLYAKTKRLFADRKGKEFEFSGVAVTT
ncbi:ERF family protein [Tyzzerella sp. OttesenSCG-928-J15]|nr:ERF family protein [Tyzzerella sp. OttesenSCG-928-J15]